MWGLFVFFVCGRWGNSTHLSHLNTVNVGAAWGVINLRLVAATHWEETVLCVHAPRLSYMVIRIRGRVFPTPCSLQLSLGVLTYYPWSYTALRSHTALALRPFTSADVLSIAYQRAHVCVY